MKHDRKTEKTTLFRNKWQEWMELPRFRGEEHKKTKAMKNIMEFLLKMMKRNTA